MDIDVIQRCAYQAATSWWAPAGLALEERFSIARLAILEAMAHGVVDRKELLRAANIALNAALRAERRAHGVHRDGGAILPRFWSYWRPWDEPGWAEGLIEGIAVRQVLAGLTPAMRQHILGKAAGLPVSASNLMMARKAAWKLWYDHEAPQKRRARLCHQFRFSAQDAVLVSTFIMRMRARFVPGLRITGRQRC